MSGITGVFYLDGRPVNRETIDRMVHTMPHRGPDGMHTWSEGPVALGHCMLHTTPESLQEHLPYFSPRSGCVITADARIDNRASLAALLDVRDSIEVADGEFILAAYEKWGRACVDHLIGAFAFVIWDPRQQQLFCARDQMGIKPFYYYHGPNQLFAFGTEIKSFIHLPDVPKALNELCVGLYLADAPEDHYTLYEGIYRLPPAHIMTISEAGLQKEKYWTLTPVKTAANSDEEYVAGFLEIFEEAVRARTRSAFPVASQLSGGLDSSAVTAVADEVLRKEQTGKLHTLSLRFHACPACDEGSYIDAVLAEIDAISHFIDADAYGPLRLLPEVYAVLDDEVANGNYYTFWEMFKVVAGAGGRVVLDGLDGDTAIMHGILRFGELAQDEEWDTFIREARAAAANHGHVEGGQRFLEVLGNTNWILYTYASPVIKEMATETRPIAFWRAVNALQKGFGIDNKATYKKYWRRLITPALFLKWWDRDEEISSDLNLDYLKDRFIKDFDLEAWVRELKGLKSPRRVRERQAMLYRPGFLARTLEKGDHVAAWFGLENRHPFMDIRLLQYCLGMPASQSFRGGWSRAVLRDAMKNYLPDEVRMRVDKTRMSEHVRRSLFEVDRQILDDTIPELGNMCKYLKVDQIQELHRTLSALFDKADEENIDGKDLVVLLRAVSIYYRLMYNQLGGIWAE
jgi:asparagine synthase (glutamine-hydrolysing)